MDGALGADEMIAALAGTGITFTPYSPDSSR